MLKVDGIGYGMKISELDTSLLRALLCGANNTVSFKNEKPTNQIFSPNLSLVKLQRIGGDQFAEDIVANDELFPLPL